MIPNETQLSDQPKVRVSLKRSSSKDGVEGWDIDVAEGATDEEAKRVMALALSLRMEAREALGLEPSVHYTEQLEESLKRSTAT